MRGIRSDDAKIVLHVAPERVVDIRGRNVRVQWDDGRMTSLSGAYLVPERKPEKSKSN